MAPKEANPRQEAFAKTRNAGYDAVRFGWQSRAVLHLWEHPAFGDPRAWTVFNKPRSQSQQEEVVQPYLRETRWDRTYDYKRFLEEIIVRIWDTTPRLITREIVLNADDLETQLERGRRINISVIDVDFPIGLDGVTFGIDIPWGHKGFGSVQLSWFGHGPEAWQPLIRWYHDMVSFFTQGLDEPDSE